MDKRLGQVEAVFDQTEHYLHKDSHVVARTRLVRMLLGQVKNSRILDLGCGDGRVSLQFLGNFNSITLIDISDAMLGLAQKQVAPKYVADVELIKGDLDTFELPGQYDVVICLGVLAHVNSVAATLMRIAGLTRQGGSCILQFTDAATWPGRLLHAYAKLRRGVAASIPYELNRINAKGLKAQAASIGLIFEMEHRYPPVFPGMSRLPNNWLRKYQSLAANYPIVGPLSSEVVAIFRRTDHI